MSLGSEVGEKVDETQAQVSRLRSQVEALVKEVGPCVTDAARRGSAKFTDVTGITREQAKAAIGDVTIAQVSVLVVAAAAGWALGRLMR